MKYRYIEEKIQGVKMRIQTKKLKFTDFAKKKNKRNNL